MRKDMEDLVATLGDDVLVTVVNTKQRTYGQCYCCERDLGNSYIVIGNSSNRNLKACSNPIDGHQDSRMCQKLAGDLIVNLKVLISKQKTVIETLKDLNATMKETYDKN